MNNSQVLKLNNLDDVVIAITELPAGSWLKAENIETRDLIPAGHKIALRDIPAGSAVKRYGQIIGFATRDIRQGNIFMFIISVWEILNVIMPGNRQPSS